MRKFGFEGVRIYFLHWFAPAARKKSQQLSLGGEISEKVHSWSIASSNVCRCRNRGGAIVNLHLFRRSFYEDGNRDRRLRGQQQRSHCRRLCGRQGHSARNDSRRDEGNHGQQ